MFDEEAQRFRWFVLPSEANACLHHGIVGQVSPIDIPFCPPDLLARLGYVEESRIRSASQRDAIFHDDFENCDQDKPRQMASFSKGFSQLLEGGFSTVNGDGVENSDKDGDLDFASKCALDNPSSDSESGLKSVHVSRRINNDSESGGNTEVSNIKTIISTSSDTKDPAEVLNSLNKSVSQSSNTELNSTNNSMSCPYVKKRSNKSSSPDKPADTLSEQVRWFSPPKDIFKPTVAVSYFNKSVFQ